MQQHLGLEQQLGEMGRVTHSGFKMRGMIKSASIDIFGGVQLMVCLLYERLLYTHFVRPGSAPRLDKSPNRGKIPANLYSHFK